MPAPVLMMPLVPPMAPFCAAVPEPVLLRVTSDGVVSMGVASVSPSLLLTVCAAPDAARTLRPAATSTVARPLERLPRAAVISDTATHAPSAGFQTLRNDLFMLCCPLVLKAASLD